MQIYRKCRHYSDWCAEGVFADTWKSWGFIDAYTGKEIQPNATYNGSYSWNESFQNNKTHWFYKWKYDSVDPYNHFIFQNVHNPAYGYTIPIYLGFNLSNRQYFLADRETNKFMEESYSSTSNRITYKLSPVGNTETDTTIYNSGYYNMFFIPLKNNGFFFNFEASWPPISGNEAPDTNGLPSRLTTYFKQTSPYLWDLYSYKYIRGIAGRTPKTANATVIGFYNNIDNKMNYLRFVIPDQSAPTYTNLNPKTIYETWDCKNNSILTSIPCADSDGSYTDVKENICTLIKYPYATGALSNLFIISTCPERKGRSFVEPEELAPDSCGLEGKFFSFSGRNFYGFYNNLAVELPSN